MPRRRKKRNKPLAAERNAARKVLRAAAQLVPEDHPDQEAVQREMHLLCTQIGQLDHGKILGRMSWFQMWKNNPRIPEASHFQNWLDNDQNPTLMKIFMLAMCPYQGRFSMEWHGVTLLRMEGGSLEARTIDEPDTLELVDGAAPLDHSMRDRFPYNLPRII